MNGQTVLAEAWEDRSELSRMDGPALWERFPNGNWLFQEWWHGGERHRVGAPAILNYNDEGTGQLQSEEWWVDGERHREDGPAKVVYDQVTGDVAGCEWWIRGVQIDHEKLFPGQGTLL